jgi:carboxyl-terminal processing protease
VINDIPFDSISIHCSNPERFRKITKKQSVLDFSYIDEIFAEGEKQNIKPRDDEERQKATENMRFIIKALVARDLWDMSEYFALIYENDEVVKKAVELLQGQ